MSGTVFTYNMPSGVPGAMNRLGFGFNDTEAQVMDPDNPLPYYGLAGMIDATSGFFRTMDSGDTTIYGFLVRPFPLQATTAALFSGESPLGTQAVPPQAQVAIDVMKVGYMTVKLYGADSAVKNGTVYVIVDGEDATHPLGGVCAADDGANRIAVNAYFTGPQDANGNVEIAFNIN